MTTWRDDLKVDDLVIVHIHTKSDDRHNVARVAAASKRYVTVHGRKFRRVDGQLAGGGMSIAGNIEEATPARRTEVMRQSRMARLRRELACIPRATLDALTYEQLVRIEDIINEAHR